MQSSGVLVQLVLYTGYWVWPEWGYMKRKRETDFYKRQFRFFQPETEYFLTVEHDVYQPKINICAQIFLIPFQAKTNKKQSLYVLWIVNTNASWSCNLLSCCPSHIYIENLFKRQVLVFNFLTFVHKSSHKIGHF